MPVKRTQIRGIKDAKKSNKENKAVNAVKKSFKKNVKAEANEEKMQNKAAKKFAIGGRITKVKTNEYGVNYPASSAGKYEIGDKTYTQTNDYRNAVRRDDFIRDSTYADNASYKRVINGARPYGDNFMKNGNSAGTYAGVKAGEARALKDKSANKKACGGKLKSTGKKFKCGGKMKKK